MKSRLDLLRCRIADRLDALIVVVLPASMRELARRSAEMRLGIDYQIRNGCTFGVALTAWSLDEAGAEKAEWMMQEIAEAYVEARKAMDE